MSSKQQLTSHRIRIAGATDAEVITTLINDAFRPVEGFFIDEDRIDIDQVRGYLGSGNFLVAESEGGVVGCVYVEKRGERSYLGLLSVDPTCQRSGLGSVLMNEAEDHCRRLGCRIMDMLVVNLREDLTVFYSKRGYVETGRSPFPENIKTKVPCHFIEMSKQL
jgi:N-acetylglutamate synthase-like GNAT family acetyltransferase